MLAEPSEAGRCSKGWRDWLIPGRWLGVLLVLVGRVSSDLSPFWVVLRGCLGGAIGKFAGLTWWG